MTLRLYTLRLLKLVLTEKGERLVETGMAPEDVEELVTLLEAPDLGALYVKMKLRALTPEERLKGLDDPEELLKGLEPEIIEAYLAQLKRDEQH